MVGKSVWAQDEVGGPQLERVAHAANHDQGYKERGWTVKDNGPSGRLIVSPPGSIAAVFKVVEERYAVCLRPQANVPCIGEGVVLNLEQVPAVEEYFEAIAGEFDA